MRVEQDASDPHRVREEAEGAPWGRRILTVSLSLQIWAAPGRLNTFYLHSSPSGLRCPQQGHQCLGLCSRGSAHESGYPTPSRGVRFGKSHLQGRGHHSPGRGGVLGHLHCSPLLPHTHPK